jgi:hypothetical protein
MRRRLPSMSPAPPNAGGDLFAANLTGALLALTSSAFIGVSFIVKKKGSDMRLLFLMSFATSINMDHSFI